MFDTMISKSLVQVIWIVWSGLIAVAGLVALFQSGSLLEALIVLVGTALGLGFARVLCEGMIVIFMIHENLAGSRAALEKLQAGQSNPSGRFAAPTTVVPRSQTYSQPELQPGSTSAPARVTAPSEGTSVKSATPEPIKKDDYHDRMMAIRDQLQRDAQQKRN